MNLSAVVSSLNTVRSPDADTRRRGSNLIALSLAMASLALLLSAVSLIRADPSSNPGLIAGAALVFLGAAALGRVGHVNIGSWLVVVISVAIPLSFVSLDTAALNAIPFLVPAVLLAGVLLPPAQIWLVLTLCVVGVLFAIGRDPGAATLDTAAAGLLASPVLLLAIVALIGYLSASSVRAALREAQEARREAEAASEALAASNAALERRVEERTAALRQVAEEQRAATAELKASLQAQHDLNRIVAELSVPVIPVSDETLVVPLVGNIDSARADQILGSILARVEAAGARTVVLDVTGVAIVDTHVAGALLRVAQATRLMGARAVLAGIRPEVAQAIVGLGVDLRDLHTVATLQEAL